MAVDGGDSWHSVARVEIQTKSSFINPVAHGKNIQAWAF